MKTIFSSILYPLVVLAGTASLWSQATPTPTPQLTKEQIEAIKAKNARAEKMNILIKQYNDASSSKNWADAIAPLQELIVMEPSDWQYYSGLGDTQLHLGKYQEAIAAYDKGIENAQAILSNGNSQNIANPHTDPAKAKAGLARMLTNEGNCYLKLKRHEEAIAAYYKAAALDPNPGTAYFNICATQYNTGNVDGALPACDKAIAADPTKADAYYIKGSLLIGESKTDASGHVQSPPGAAEALQRYLELAPNGSHADEVRQMLGYIGAPVSTTYNKNK